MAAVTELASAVGTRAACRALFARLLLSPTAFVDPSQSAQVAAFTGSCAFSGGMRNRLDASARRALPGSLARRCLCDVARCRRVSLLDSL